MKTRFSLHPPIVLVFFLSLLILIMQPLTVLGLESPVRNVSQYSSIGSQRIQSISKELDLGRDSAADNIMSGPGRVGDPITIYNGNNNEIVEDLRFFSPSGWPFIFERSYNSRSEEMSCLGYGWTNSYCVSFNPSYYFKGDIYLEILDETGRGVYFKNVGGGHFAGAFMETTILERQGEHYLWYRIDGRRFFFNSNGQLIRIEGETGNDRSFTYDSHNRLETAIDEASGRILTFHYDASGKLISITSPVTTAMPDTKESKFFRRLLMRETAPVGVVWVRYGYDNNQNLTSVTYIDGSGFDYRYTDPGDIHNLTEKRNKMGHFLASWKYDNQDRAVENVSRNGNGASIKYINEHKVEVTDAYGITKTYTIWDVNGRDKVTDIEGPEDCPTCSADVKRMEYNSAGRIIELEYANGLINQYDDFDSRGNAGTVKTALLTSYEKKVNRTFHPDIDTKLSETEPSVFGVGNKVTIWDYDNDGNDIPNENPSRLIYRKIDRGFTKDTSGATVPFEYITVCTYNEKGQVTGIDAPQPGTQSTITFAYDTVTGIPVSVTRPVIGTITAEASVREGHRVTDPNGNTLVYTYDGRGRIKTITDQADGSVTTTYDYNIAGDLAHVTAPNGMTLKYTYSKTYGRLFQVEDALGNYIQYAYDFQGNCTEERRFTPTGECRFWRRFDYNGPTKPGKLWKVINPDDTYTEYTYDAGGNVHKVKDPTGKTTIYEYDVLNRLITMTQSKNIIKSYAYDCHDNLVAVTDAEKHTTHYVYDDLGRLISATVPDKGATTYTYDAAGNLIAKKNSSGVTITYTYDAANRLTAIHFPDSNQDITYAYDQGIGGKGRLTGMTDKSGSYTYAYDALGNLITEKKTIDAITYTTQYMYDPAGILTGITYPSGRTVTYELNCSGRVKRVITAKDGTICMLAENISYHPFGPLNGLTHGNGTVMTKTYDQLYRMKGADTCAIKYSDSTTYPSGNTRAIMNKINSAKSQALTCNDPYHLFKASTQSSTYKTASMGFHSLAHNLKDLLIQEAEKGINPGDYVYNGRGQRMKKIAKNSTTIYHYDRFNNLIGESTPAGVFIIEYFYLNGARLTAIAGETAQ